MDKKILAKLADLADSLDRRGFLAEADAADSLIRMAAEEVDTRPEMSIEELIAEIQRDMANLKQDPDQESVSELEEDVSKLEDYVEDTDESSLDLDAIFEDMKKVKSEPSQENIEDLEAELAELESMWAF